jgi:hypothetical protein
MVDMTNQQRKLLRARVALSFYEVHGRQPKPEELEYHVKNAQLYGQVIAPTFVKQKSSRTLTL